MKKRFALPLLATLPTLLAACGADDIDLDGYKRKSFRSQTECRAYYKKEINQGLRNPCYRASGSALFFGPYFLASRLGTRYLGYDSRGKVSRSGLSISPRGVPNTFRAPTVSRGGFTNSSRASGTSSGTRSSGSFGG